MLLKKYCLLFVEAGDGRPRFSRASKAETIMFILHLALGSSYVVLLQTYHIRQGKRYYYVTRNRGFQRNAD